MSKFYTIIIAGVGFISANISDISDILKKLKINTIKSRCYFSVYTVFTHTIKARLTGLAFCIVHSMRIIRKSCRALRGYGVPPSHPGFLLL